MIRQWLRTCLMALCLGDGLGFLLPSNASAQTAVSVIYQPLRAHMAIDEATWRPLFDRLHTRGIDTLVFQWTQHDTAFSSDDEAAWLQRRVADAVAADLNLILGLSADSEVFQRLQQPDTVLPAYFRKIREKDRALVRQWQNLVPPERLTGWYLPLEIDDKRWRTPGAQAALTDYLQHARREIDAAQKAPRPLFISSFFTGQMTPSRYAHLLNGLHSATGIQLWVQDGRGTGRLNALERQQYLSALTRCQAPIIQGVIYEAFRQVSAHSADGLEAGFRAAPLTTAEQTRLLKTRAPCGLDTSFFGLNYLGLKQLPTPGD